MVIMTVGMTVVMTVVMTVGMTVVVTIVVTVVMTVVMTIVIIKSKQRWMPDRLYAMRRLCKEEEAVRGGQEILCGENR